MTTDKTPSQIEVVPLASGGYGVTIGGRFCSGDYPQQIWCGTEAEALAKKAELEEKNDASK